MLTFCSRQSTLSLPTLKTSLLWVNTHLNANYFASYESHSIKTWWSIIYICLTPALFNLVDWYFMMYRLAESSHISFSHQVCNIFFSKIKSHLQVLVHINSSTLKLGHSHCWSLNCTPTWEQLTSPSLYLLLSTQTPRMRRTTSSKHLPSKL